MEKYKKRELIIPKDTHGIVSYHLIFEPMSKEQCLSINILHLSCNPCSDQAVARMDPISGSGEE